MNTLYERPGFKHMVMTACVGLLSLLCLSFFSSCSKDNPTTPNTAQQFVKVKPGSTFTFDEYSTDSTNTMIPGSQITSVSTILRTDGAIAGKTGVVVVENARAGALDTTYFTYETNNNVSVLGTSPSTGVPLWFTLPVGTGVKSIASSADSATELGLTTVARDTITVSLLGTESMTVKGASLSVKKVQLSFHVVMTVNGLIFIDVTGDNLIYYAPTLGFIAKTSFPARQDPGGGWTEGNVQTLVDYDLK